MLFIICTKKEKHGYFYFSSSTKWCFKNWNRINEPSKAKRMVNPSFFNCSPRLAIHLKPVSVSSKWNPSTLDMVSRILDDTVDDIMTALLGSTPLDAARCHIHQPSRQPNSLPVKIFHNPLYNRSFIINQLTNNH